MLPIKIKTKLLVLLFPVLLVVTDTSMSAPTSSDHATKATWEEKLGDNNHYSSALFSLKSGYSKKGNILIPSIIKSKEEKIKIQKADYNILVHLLVGICHNTNQLQRRVFSANLNLKVE